MEESKKSDVKIDYSPLIPKDRAATFVQLILASEDTAKWARKYLETGSLTDARQLLNARMKLKSMGCKSHLPQIEGNIVHNDHPLSDEEKETVTQLLKEADGQAGV